MVNEYDLWWATMSDQAGLRSMRLYREAGSSKSLFFMKKEELMKYVSEKLAEHIIYRRNTWDHGEILRKMEAVNMRCIPFYDPAYPKRLLRTSGYPFALFVIGDLPDEDKPAVALIGARECSEYGRQAACYFGAELARHGVSVLSGMAIGIDGIGQQAALEAGGCSYAVLGSGADVVYPASNRALYRKLIQKGGVISEYGPGEAAVSWHFPARNRILAGMSDLVIVIEAKEKSGTLITVDMALDAGRDVAIVPGRITDTMSVGCMRLWKAGAYPVFHVEDVLDILKDSGFSVEKLQCGSTDPGSSENKITLEREENIVYSCFDLYARSAEEVLERAKLPYQELLRIMSALESKGLIKEVSRGYYIRTGNNGVKQHTDSKVLGG